MTILETRNRKLNLCCHQRRINMDYPPQIATVLNEDQILCFRCSNKEWEDIGSEMAICVSCRNLNYVSYGIAELNKDNNSIRVYVYNDSMSNIPGIMKYGSDSYGLIRDGHGFSLLGSTLDDFEVYLEETLIENKIACPSCGNNHRWGEENGYGYKRGVRYRVCGECNLGFAETVRGCEFFIKIY